jgi:hypothetical protein
MVSERPACDYCGKEISRSEPVLELRHQDDEGVLYFHNECSQSMGDLPIVDKEAWLVTTRHIDPERN